MDGLKDLLFPIAIAMLAAFMAAIFAINLRFASSKEEAMNDVANLGKTLITGSFAVWLLYDLFSRGVSSEPIARAEILLMILDAISLVLILGYFIVRKLLELHRSSIEAAQKHFDLTNRIVSLHLANNDDQKSTGLDVVSKSTSE